jgi:hypothetical protein
MNHWHMEVMAELHRRELEREMEGIYIVEQVLARRVHRPAWFAVRMFGLANWMIATGKQMRRRYETPALGCEHERTRSYAR